jgi:kynureninase
MEIVLIPFKNQHIAGKLRLVVYSHIKYTKMPTTEENAMSRSSLDYARQLDRQDPLKGMRSRFFFAEEELIYLDGNSLGRMPQKSQRRAQELISYQWGEGLVRSWGEHWMDLPRSIGKKIAGVIGAKPHEVIIAESTSVNLYKLAMTALRYKNDRTKIITDDLNFPSDIYILQGIVDTLQSGHQIEVIPSPDNIHGPTQEILEAIDESTALVTLSHTAFKSGFVYDIEKITQHVHKKGALVLWDLSHSAGSVVVNLNAAQADLAIGCTYKYLNGGPGAPAFLYIRDELQERLHNPISGWWGHLDMFAFDLEYQPQKDLRRFLTGSTPILSIALIEPGIDTILEAGIENLRYKSVQQTEYLISLWEEYLRPLGYRLNSPRNSQQRGSHVSLGHDEGLRIDKALIERYKIIPDFRTPDNIRLGIAPLYTTFEEIFLSAMAMKEIVENKIYEDYSNEIPPVT